MNWKMRVNYHIITYARGMSFSSIIPRANWLTYSPSELLDAFLSRRMTTFNCINKRAMEFLAFFFMWPIHCHLWILTSTRLCKAEVSWCLVLLKKFQIKMFLWQSFRFWCDVETPTFSDFPFYTSNSTEFSLQWTILHSYMYVACIGREMGT